MGGRKSISGRGIPERGERRAGPSMGSFSMTSSYSPWGKTESSWCRRRGRGKVPGPWVWLSGSWGFSLSAESEALWGEFPISSLYFLVLWEAGPIKWCWSCRDRIKCIQQNGITHVNQDGCRSATTLWFKKETT